jgi:hypothetical protein
VNIYLNTQEQKILRQVAEELGVSQSFCMRLLFRHAVGLPTSNTARVNADISLYVQKLTGVGQ